MLWCRLCLLLYCRCFGWQHFTSTTATVIVLSTVTTYSLIGSTWTVTSSIQLLEISTRVVCSFSVADRVMELSIFQLQTLLIHSGRSWLHVNCGHCLDKNWGGGHMLPVPPPPSSSYANDKALCGPDIIVEMSGLRYIWSSCVGT